MSAWIKLFSSWESRLGFSIQYQRKTQSGLSKVKGLLAFFPRIHRKSWRKLESYCILDRYICSQFHREQLSQEAEGTFKVQETKATATGNRLSPGKPSANRLTDPDLHCACDGIAFHHLWMDLAIGAGLELIWYGHDFRSDAILQHLITFW